jgi:glycerol kinase
MGSFVLAIDQGTTGSAVALMDARGKLRATLDAMALQNADILRAMEADLGKRMKPLRVDGGAAAPA